MSSVGQAGPTALRSLNKKRQLDVDKPRSGGAVGVVSGGTELEIGNLSSSSSDSEDELEDEEVGEEDDIDEDDDEDAEDNEEDEDLDEEEIRDENDVDCETMSGENDVNEYSINYPSLLSDLDSLTEQSLESLTSRSHSQILQHYQQPKRHAQRNNDGSSSSTSIEDKMLLLRLMEMQQSSGAAGISVPNILTPTFPSFGSASANDGAGASVAATSPSRPVRFLPKIGDTTKQQNVKRGAAGAASGSETSKPLIPRAKPSLSEIMQRPQKSEDGNNHHQQNVVHQPLSMIHTTTASTSSSAEEASNSSAKTVRDNEIGIDDDDNNGEDDNSSLAPFPQLETDHPRPQPQPTASVSIGMRNNIHIMLFFLLL